MRFTAQTHLNQATHESTDEAPEAQTRWRLAAILWIVTLFSLLLIEPAQAQAYQTISFGDRIQNTVTTSQGDHWYFSASANETVSLRMTSSTFDTYLEVLDSNGAVLCFNDDYDFPTDRNAYITSCRLPSNGRYQVVARGYSGATGRYELTFQRTAAPNPVTPVCAQGRHIGYGSRVTGSVTCAQGTQWTFYGTAGEWVEIGMYSDGSDTIDTYLELLDPHGNRIASNDDISTNNRNSFIRVDHLPMSGRYTIVARGYSGDTGTYRLTLD